MTVLQLGGFDHYFLRKDHPAALLLATIRPVPLNFPATQRFLSSNAGDKSMKTFKVTVFHFAMFESATVEWPDLKVVRTAKYCQLLCFKDAAA